MVTTNQFVDCHFYTKVVLRREAGFLVVAVLAGAAAADVEADRVCRVSEKVVLPADNFDVVDAVAAAEEELEPLRAGNDLGLASHSSSAAESSFVFPFSAF